MKNLILISLFFWCGIALAQESRKWDSHFNYQQEQENAQQKKYFIGLHLAGMEMATADILRVPAELKVLVNPIKFLWGEASYSKTYFSAAKYLGKDCDKCENKFKTNGKLEVGARFSFADKIRLKREKISLKTEQIDYKTTKTTYGIYKIPKRRIWGIRGGGYFFNEMASSKWAFEKDNSNALLNERMANYKNQGIYAGLSTTTLVNTSFKTKENGDYSVNYLNDFYLDVMFSLNDSMDDFIVNGTPVKALLNTGDKNSFVSDNLGVRFGFNMFTIRKLVGMTMNVELGFHPGIKNNFEGNNIDRRLYAGFKAGMCFSK